MPRTRRVRRLDAPLRRLCAGTAVCAALLASSAARAQDPPPPTAPAEPVAPAPATPAAQLVAPSPATPPAQPPAAAPPPAATPAPSAAPAPYPYPYYPAPYPYPYPYPYPPAPGAGNPYPAYPAPVAVPGAAPVVTTLAATPSADGPARAPSHDPQADRGVLLPTAYTHPKGTYFLSTYDLVLEQLGYALTDDTQLSLTSIPFVGEPVALVDLTLKTSLYRGQLVRIAALGSTSGIVAPSLGVLGVGRVGGVAQVCFQVQCEDSITLSSNVTLAAALVMVNGVGGIYRLSRMTSLLAELDTLVPLGNFVDGFGGALGSGGVRFHGTNWGLDLAVMHVLGRKTTLPLVALTYRSTP
jgi:hypothetical protein